MSMNRVQKLLFSEYCDFEDLVLIESPFAQTTKEGRGLRQVHIGLTPSKLILATDILPSLEKDAAILNEPTIDPEIETFELIAIYPVECVSLSVYRRKRRQALKARFCNNKVLYFELGGFERRAMFWNLWCEKVKFLSPQSDADTSRSETSVATSTTGSSLYLLEKRVVAINGLKQLWCRFGPNFGVDTHFINEVLASSSQSLAKKWTDKHLYIGKDFQQCSLEYGPLISFPTLHEFIKPQKSEIVKRRSHITLMKEKRLGIGDTVLVNRFGSGIDEKCRAGLYLPINDYVSPNMALQSLPSIESDNLSTLNYEDMAENAVFMWELNAYKTNNTFRSKHRRRYGFSPKTLFLYGLGPWALSKGDRYSVQIKRACSEVNLRSPDLDSELKLPVSRRQLTATVSCPDLTEFRRSSGNNIINAPKKPVILFWTPNYWYRPVSARDAYSDLQKHLKKLREYIQKRKKCKRRYKAKKKKVYQTTDGEESDVFYKRKKKKHSFISNMFGSKIEENSNIDLNDDQRYPHESPLQYLKRMLRYDCKLTSWALDSTTMAHQLTMIDKDLFLKVPSCELQILLHQKTCRNAPNIAALIAFSHRISCLIATEILRDDSDRYRARLMARYINVANKCHRISNFQSCRTVLLGLQNPAIFRLRNTWAYVRKKHASKYQIFEFLCRLYRDPRMPSYQKTFFIFSQSPPFLPYIGHIILKLLDKIPKYKIFTKSRASSTQLSFCTTSNITPRSEYKSSLPDPNIFSKIFKVFSNSSTEKGAGDNIDDKLRKVRKKQKSFTKLVSFKGLYEYFPPLDCYGNNTEQLIAEVTDTMEKSQLGAMHYNFQIHQPTRDFLLKARYEDDMDNFLNSLTIESPNYCTSSDNKNKNCI